MGNKLLHRKKIINSRYFRFFSVCLLALSSLGPISIGNNYAEVQETVRQLKTKNSQGKAQCETILVVTDLDYSAIHPVDKIRGDEIQKEDAPYRGSETVLPALAREPGVTTLALTSRPIVRPDPRTILDLGATPEEYIKAMEEWKRLEKKRGDIWRPNMLNPSKVDLQVRRIGMAPFGSSLEEVEQAFPKLRGTNYHSVFNFPELDDQYWFAPYQTDEFNLVPKKKRENVIWLELNEWKDAGRLVGYWNGIVATSELNKGFALKKFLEAEKARNPNNPKYNFECILFADDQMRNLKGMKEAFSKEYDEGKLFLFHFKERWPPNRTSSFNSSNSGSSSNPRAVSDSTSKPPRSDSTEFKEESKSSGASSSR